MARRREGRVPGGWGRGAGSSRAESGGRGSWRAATLMVCAGERAGVVAEASEVVALSMGCAGASVRVSGSAGRARAVGSSGGGGGVASTRRPGVPCSGLLTLSWALAPVARSTACGQCGQPGARSAEVVQAAVGRSEAKPESCPRERWAGGGRTSARSAGREAPGRPPPVHRDRQTRHLSTGPPRHLDPRFSARASSRSAHRATTDTDPQAPASPAQSPPRPYETRTLDAG